MLTKEQNERLTGVGPGTPCGELLRRYWHPIIPAAELPPERPKKRVRLLGEDLVIYRDPDGSYGCVAEHCAHRGCSLYYGFLEDGGIRCAYHGWLWAADGRCLEQPFEPQQSMLKYTVRQTGKRSRCCDSTGSRRTLVSNLAFSAGRESIRGVMPPPELRARPCAHRRRTH